MPHADRKVHGPAEIEDSVLSLTFTDITRLRRRDLRLDGNILVATTRAGERFRLGPDPETRDNLAVSSYRRWVESQAFLGQHPGTHLLRCHLTDPSEIIADPLDAEQARQPLLCPIDRWGHLPHAQPMTSQSVSPLVRAHLSGRAAVCRTLPVTAQGNAHTWDEPKIELEPECYARGTAARHGDHEALEDLGDLINGIEQRADTLLQELMGVREGCRAHGYQVLTKDNLASFQLQSPGRRATCGDTQGSS